MQTWIPTACSDVRGEWGGVLVEEPGVVMRTDNENKKLEEARNIIIDALGRVYALYGLPDVIGRIYGVLFLADRPLGLEDIAQMLGVSKSTVSINIRILEGVGNVRKVWVKGSRRDHYEAERNISKIAAETIQKNYEREIEIVVEAAQSSKNLLTDVCDRPEDGLKDKAKFYYEHIDYLESQYNHFGRILAEMLITVFQEEDKE